MTEQEPLYTSENQPKLLPSITVDSEIEPQLEEVMAAYLEHVQNLDILSGVLIGRNEEVKGGYLWNVFKEEVSFKDDMNYTPYRELNKLGYELQKTIKGVIPLRISHANPSQLAELKEDCERKNIKTQLISLYSR